MCFKKMSSVLKWYRYIYNGNFLQTKALKTLVWHALVNGANEMSSLKNKQTVMYDEQIQTNKAKDKQSQGRTDLGMNFVR